MRPIKFRAWSAETKEMIPWEEFFMEWFDDDSVIVMQFTGLKDKNGKEIYEGDIVKSERVSTLWIIVWQPHTATFGYVTPNFRQDNHFRTVEGSACEWMTTETWAGLEVIGNIYSNPELVK